MEKILTVSVAAYQVQDYLRQNLDSIVKSKYIDEIEVFVVDDGGKDGSLAIAQEYERQYPDSVHAIHKENGGYGTTVNWSASHATGKYFRLLDGDDWFDTECLDTFIAFLKENDADLFLTETKRVINGDASSSVKKWTKYDRQILRAEDITDHFDFGMWASTYSTKLVQQYLRPLPSHSLYTDVLFTTYPLPYVKTIGFLSEYLYCYRLGLDEQSVSRASRNKHYMEYQNIIETVKKYYYEVDGNQLPQILRTRFFMKYKLEIFNLMILPISKENRAKIIEMEKRTKQEAPEFYEAAKESRKISLMRKTNYLAYWPIAKWANNEW